MAVPFKTLTDFLVELGIDQIGHTNKSYLAHLIGVYKYLERMGCSDDVVLGGMFHSIYGTEQFQGFKLPLEDRAKVRALVGERAERLGYLNCAMDRPTFDRSVSQTAAPHRFKDRLTGAEFDLSEQDFDDLCRIHLYDWLEQVPRCEMWDHRRTAYRSMAERLGPVAVAEYDRVFAGEKVGVAG